MLVGNEAEEPGTLSSVQKQIPVGTQEKHCQEFGLGFHPEVAVGDTPLLVGWMEGCFNPCAAGNVCSESAVPSQLGLINFASLQQTAYESAMSMEI